ncbi:hypothetical protein IAR50_004929 [Cryptococcus sp. DSM 104548]
MELYVPEHILKAHSQVLCSMIDDLPSPTSETDSPRLIELTDPNIEGYKTLHLFLAVVTETDLDGAIAGDEEVGKRGDTIFMVARLMTLYLIGLAGKGQEQNINSPFDLFIVAAQMNLPDIAATVIRVYETDQSAAAELMASAATWPFLPNDKMFGIPFLSPGVWDVIPSNYLRAVYEASMGTQDAVLTQSRKVSTGIGSL